MNSAPPSSGGPVPKPPGTASVVKRKKPTSDPFFKEKKKPSKPQPNGHPTPPLNGNISSKPHPLRSATPVSQRDASPAKTAINPAERVSGFSDPRITAEGIPFRDYKLVTTKRDLLNGLRYHVLQLAVDKPLDIRNESDFTKPARLHRRDPRAAPPGQLREDGEEPRDGFTAAEREELNKRKEARQKEREANLAQIAPSAGAGRKTNNFKKKTQQVFNRDYSTEEKRRIQTNYEEKLPWHLEDFDNKHCFLGHNQIGSMGVHAAFVFEPAAGASNGKFRLIPVEKVYQFKPKRDIAIPMTIEEVEAAMKKKGGDPEWLIRQREARLAEASRDMAAKKSKGLFSGAQTQSIAGRGGEEADLDFEDDFADDEEGDLFEVKDEDEKLAEKKIKEDQLQANFLDFKDLREYDEAEEREKKEAEARKKNFRDLRKALEKRERNYNHGSDSDHESSTTDSEEERERLEKEKLAAAKKEEDLDGKKSAMSSSGTNTPSGRREKHHGGTASDREGRGITKSSSSKSLKRPGSPNLSDASGTDASTRKKKPKMRHLSSTQPTPGPSRPRSPANVPGSQSLDPSSAGLLRNRGSFNTNYPGSDTDGAAMSDSNPRRIKLKISSPPATANTSQPTSRAASPVPRPSSTAPAPAFPSAQDVKDKIPPGGISIKDLMKLVAHPKDRRPDFVNLVKEVARMDKERGLLVLK